MKNIREGYKENIQNKDFTLINQDPMNKFKLIFHKKINYNMKTNNV